VGTFAVNTSAACNNMLGDVAAECCENSVSVWWQLV